MDSAFAMVLRSLFSVFSSLSCSTVCLRIFIISAVSDLSDRLARLRRAELLKKREGDKMQDFESMAYVKAREIFKKGKHI